MARSIGGYECLTPMRTAGSGSARWCVASRGLERFFLKEFLSPVYPVREDTELGKRQRERCERFEARKQRLYEAVSCVIGDTLVPVIDFFRFERRYYAVSELVTEESVTLEDADGLSQEEKRALLFSLGQCLQRLHAQGVVHADLKPEHVLLLKRPGGLRARLIDLDSGFLRGDPPSQMEGDPAYLAPESFLRMTGQEVPVGPEADTFAFGILIHRLWTGEWPGFDRERFQYLYEAVLSGDRIALSDRLPPAYRRTVRRMLHASPEARPSDLRVAALFAPRGACKEAAPPANGLQHLWKRGIIL